MRTFKLLSLALGAVLMLAFLLAGVTVQAAGLTVGYLGGKGLSPEVQPGESYCQTLTVSIGADRPATEVTIEVLGYGSTPENDTLPLAPEEDTGAHSARRFIQPSQLKVLCEPGQTAKAEVTVTVPKDIRPGGYYAILRFATAPPEGSSTVGTVQSIVLPVKFTVPGELVHTGKITGISTSEATSGNPVEIYLLFQNTGNHHFGIKGSIEVLNSAGQLLDTVYVNSFSPVPDGIKKIRAYYVPQAPLATGTYRLKARLTLEDGSLLDEAEGSFEVKAPYVPPPPPASITLKPAEAAALHTDDGRIFIDFPRGTVLGETVVSLRSYPPEQVPAPPPGYKTGITCFRVDGLTGLLAKEAKITVKYSSADLEKAVGDPARLRLARWDEAEGRWTILKTGLDRNTQTLTTSTSRFSIWAVMADARPAGSFNWRLLSTIGLIVVLVVIGVLLVTGRKKKQN